MTPSSSSSETCSNAIPGLVASGKAGKVRFQETVSVRIIPSERQQRQPVKPQVHRVCTCPSKNCKGKIVKRRSSPHPQVRTVPQQTQPQRRRIVVREYYVPAVTVPTPAVVDDHDYEHTFGIPYRDDEKCFHWCCGLAMLFCL